MKSKIAVDSLQRKRYLVVPFLDSEPPLSVFEVMKNHEWAKDPTHSGRFVCNSCGVKHTGKKSAYYHKDGCPYRFLMLAVEAAHLTEKAK